MDKARPIRVFKKSLKNKQVTYFHVGNCFAQPDTDTADERRGVRRDEKTYKPLFIMLP